MIVNRAASSYRFPRKEAVKLKTHNVFAQRRKSNNEVVHHG